jgi:hypothetical protein
MSPEKVNEYTKGVMAGSGMKKHGLVGYPKETSVSFLT